MRHIDYTATTRTGNTTSEWLRVGANIAQAANGWAGRTDIVTFVGEGATEGLAAALFKPEIAEIEIDVKQTFGFGVRPETIADLTQRSTRYEFPKATGAIMHEAFHARFSRWSIPKAIKDLQSDEFGALMLLEEGRIESHGLNLDPKYRPFLRASALELAIGELDSEQLSELNVASAAKLLSLVEARVIGGILRADEVAEITTMVSATLGENVFTRLSEICETFQSHSNHWAIESAYPLAVEWAKIVRDLQDERGEEPEQDSGENSGEGKPSPEKGEGEGESSMSKILKALAEAAEDVEISNSMDLYDQEQTEEWDEQIENRKSEAKEQQTAVDTSTEIFGRGTGETAANNTMSRLKESRTPASNERVAAVTVARMLEKAKYRDRDVTVVSSQIPQGRLNTRAAIQNSAQKSQGRMPTANEWSRKVRRQTEEPTLNVGVMVDISGSMRPAMEAMATTAWVMSEAVRRVQGKAAMVYYGQDVFATLKAGQHLDGVNVWTANDPTEKFDKAFKALDGSLNLLHGSGARLLVVVSDGVYTDGESNAATKWVKRCQAEGVAVLWLTFQENHYSHASRICKGTNAVVLSGRLDPADAAVEIGKAAAHALEIASAARAA
jgi:hypothetical protein